MSHYKTYKINKKSFTKKVVETANIESLEYTFPCDPPTIIVNPPPPDELPIECCAVLGKELDCEGLPGIVRVVWCTSRNGDSKVEVGIESGVYLLEFTDEELTKCHVLDFPIIAVDTKHYFRVISVDSDENEAICEEYVFCTGSEITIIPPDGSFIVSCSMSTHTPVVIEKGITIALSEIDIDHPLAGPEEFLHVVDITTHTPTTLEKTINNFSTEITFNVT